VTGGNYLGGKINEPNCLSGGSQYQLIIIIIIIVTRTWCAVIFHGLGAQHHQEAVPPEKIWFQTMPKILTQM
jgi:hypothetical protein